MRNFADLVRLPAPQKRQVDLVQLLQDLIGLMQQKAGEKDIRFVGVLPNEPVFVIADPQQLEQALINITKNAMEAIQYNGEVVFTLDRYARTLAIADTGSGFTDSEAEQLFSPFFSTKPDGQGIGLTLVKEILVNHGFEFSLKRADEKHTVFLLKF